MDRKDTAAPVPTHEGTAGWAAWIKGPVRCVRLEKGDRSLPLQIPGGTPQMKQASPVGFALG